MKRVITLITAICITQGVATAQSNRIICDETCKSEASGNISGVTSSSEMNYAVVSPVGRGTVEMIHQAPRLTTLDGKTIAVVGGSFMASVTHPEIKRLILEHYPSAKVLLLDEIGSAGVYPAPGVVRRSKEEFQARLVLLCPLSCREFHHRIRTLCRVLTLCHQLNCVRLR